MKINLTGNLKTAIACIAMASLSIVLSGCTEAISASGKLGNSRFVPNDVVKLVDREFQAHFVYGDWRYQGAKGVNGSINAFIQIPNKLKMDESTQKQYIKSALCPSASKENMWQAVKDYPIWIYLYTVDKRYGTFEACDNPIA